MIIVLHIVDAHPWSDPFGAGLGEQLNRKTARADAATLFVETLAKDLDVSIERKIGYARGNTGEAIATFAVEQDCDLILMHAQRRFSAGDLYCGNTLEQVLHVSNRPVAVLFGPSLTSQPLFIDIRYSLI